MAWPHDQKLEAVLPADWSVGLGGYGCDDLGSMMICDLETALNKFCVQQGIHIIAGEVSLGEGDESSFHSSIGFNDGNRLHIPNNLQPDLVCIAEGASSSNAGRVGEVQTLATDEIWHQTNYQVSNDIAQKMGNGSTLGFEQGENRREISNIIFHRDRLIPLINSSRMVYPEDSKNAKDGKVHAHTVKALADRAQTDIRAEHLTPADNSQQPIQIFLKRATTIARKNALVIGDSACSGSPVGGFGASLAISFWPSVVKRLAQNSQGSQHNRQEANQKFQRSGEKVVDVRWKRPFGFLQASGYCKSVGHEILQV